MLEAQETPSAPVGRKTDLLLWVAFLLGPFAAMVNTIVGYTVAHWTCDVGYKRMSFMVSAIDFVLCLGAFLLALWLLRKIPVVDESFPERGRRRFMAKSGMLLSAMCVLVVIAGTAALLILNPCD
jgi:MFS family permease